jgi:hypothetical protein
MQSAPVARARNDAGIEVAYLPYRSAFVAEVGMKARICLVAKRRPHGDAICLHSGSYAPKPLMASHATADLSRLYGAVSDIQPRAGRWP